MKQSFSSAKSIRLHPWNTLFFVVLALLLVALLGLQDFVLREFAVELFFGLLFSVPIGWLLVRLLLPQLTSRSARIAFILTAGYAATVLAGFFVIAAVGKGVFLGVCIVCALIALVLYARSVRFSPAQWRETLLTTASSIWKEPAIWIVATLALASLLAALPLLFPRQQVTSALYADFTDNDGFFHVSRVQLLSVAAPLITSPDLAGVKPSVYPDWNHFWVGQLAAWSNVGARMSYLAYAPMLLILASTITLYAVGKALTNSNWGGYIGAALGTLITFPNPYDSTFFLRNTVAATSDWNAERMHFIDLRFGMAYGIGWLMLSIVVLALALYVRHQNNRTGIGLLTLASLCIGILLRIRPHFSILILPVYLLILAYLLVTKRNWRYLVPIAVVVLVNLLLYAESTSGNYLLVSTELGIGYGVFAQASLILLPPFIRSFVSGLPPGVMPPVMILLLETLRVIGIVYSLVIIGWVIMLLRRRERPSLPQWFLFGVLVSTFLGVLFVIVEPFRSLGGDWGGQAIFILPRVAILLAIVPLWALGQSLSRRLAFVKENAPTLALIAVTLGGAVTFQGAQALLKSESPRAYFVTDAEMDAYQWISQNTAPLAVVAADPEHNVNLRGDKIQSTNFLSGMTERPAYLQRLAIRFFPEEIKRRQELLARLFEADSVSKVQSALQDATFDYLIVYSDNIPKTDLGCCMKVIRGGYPKIYQRNR